MDLTSVFGGEPAAGLFLSLVFASVVFAVLGLGGRVAARGSLRRRLEGGIALDPAQELSIRYGDYSGPFAALLKPLQSRFVPDDKRASATRRRLMQAGYMRPSAVGTFYALRVLLALGVMAALLLAAPILTRNLEFGRFIMLVPMAGILAFMLPSVAVARRIIARQRLAREGFPDCLDMLLVCVEAGLGLDAAIARVATEIGQAHPMLAEQFARVGLELRAGRSRADALRNLADRVGIDEVGSLVTLLLQSEALGASISQSLRVHADEMRSKRMLRAEEKAQMLSVKLSVPLVFCVLPALLLVIMAPGILRIADQLMPLFGG